MILESETAPHRTAPHRTIPKDKNRVEPYRVILKVEKPHRGAVLHRENTWHDYCIPNYWDSICTGRLTQKKKRGWSWVIVYKIYTLVYNIYIYIPGICDIPGICCVYYYGEKHLIYLGFDIYVPGMSKLHFESKLMAINWFCAPRIVLMYTTARVFNTGDGTDGSNPSNRQSRDHSNKIDVATSSTLTYFTNQK